MFTDLVHLSDEDLVQPENSRLVNCGSTCAGAEPMRDLRQNVIAWLLRYSSLLKHLSPFL